MTLASYGAGFGAGLLSTLSPCVLPLLPLVAAASLAAHRWGVAALAAGLALSFIGVGLFVALVGLQAGIDGDLLRPVAGLLAALFGLSLLSTRMERRFASLVAPAAGAANRVAGRLAPDGLAGQFAVGLLLGVVWTPCTGPTLGAATLLAAQGKNLSDAALVMALFGVGAALPLLLIGQLSRGAMLRWRSSMAAFGAYGRKSLGALLILIGIAVVSGLDHLLEAALVSASPAWLTGITTAL
jgi:cytochrome c-type biogenesis protein